jgi:polysaccharide biosynthesis protein PslH
MSGRKKILAVISYPFLPATTGGEISTLQILNFMGKKTQLRVFTVDPYKEINTKELDFEVDFAMRFKPSRYLNPFLLFTVWGRIRKQGSDAIFFDQPFMGWMIPFLRILSGKPIFIRSNNIEYLRFKSMGKAWWPLMKAYEKWVYRFSNLVIFVSDVDQNKAIKEFGLNQDKTLLTPYGIPQNSLPSKTENAKTILAKRHGFGLNQKIILFFATLSYQPNYEAVDFIANEIYPRLKQTRINDFVILICGKNLPQAILDKLKDKPEIQYLGFVEDIETYIDGADLMINPILSGGGVKTKAIDTLGRGQVVLSTRTGAEGIDPNVCGKNLVVANDFDWEEYNYLLNQRLDQHENSLPNTFFETYSWSGIIDKLLQKLNR